MKPLSVFTYYFRNLLKLAPVFLVLALAVFGISMTGVLSGSIRASAISKVEVYRGAAMIAPNPSDGRNSVDANIKADIAQNPHIAATFPTIRVSTYMPTLAGQTSAHIYAVNNEVFPVLMNAFELKLIQGELPRLGTNQVALHKSLMGARGFTLGGLIDREQDDHEFVPGKLQVVGVLDGPTQLSLASLEYISAIHDFRNYPRSVLAIPRAGATNAAEHALANLDQELVRPYTYSAELDTFTEEFASMDAIVWAINSIVVIVLALLAGLLNLIYFLDRMNEFGLLLGIGYSRSFVIRRALIESLVLTLFAWGFGILFSQVIYTLLNAIIFEPRGVSLTVLNWRALQFTLPIPIMVGLFSAGTVLLQLRNLDPMQMIERRGREGEREREREGERERGREGERERGIYSITLSLHPSITLSRTMLETHNVSLIYRNGEGETYAVKNASVTVNEGEFLGLVGPSGSGKSSLLYLMSGLKTASAGEVSFEGNSYQTMQNGKLIDLRRKRFGFIFQQHFLINYLSVFENIMVGALAQNKASREHANALIAELGLEKQKNRLPWQLSIGQRQRVAIARALINEPAIVFADEPTAALDQTTGHQVVDLLAHYRGHGSIVFVTHDPEMLTQADRVIRMRDGEIVSEEKRNEINGGQQ